MTYQTANWDSALYLDDERFPKTDRSWTIVRSVADAVRLMKEDGCPPYVSFDHDLGDGKPTGYDLAHWMVERDQDALGSFIPEGFAFNVHSANPVGKANIEALLNNYLRHRAES